MAFEKPFSRFMNYLSQRKNLAAKIGELKLFSDKVLEEGRTVHDDNATVYCRALSNSQIISTKEWKMHKMGMIGRYIFALSVIEYQGREDSDETWASISSFIHLQ